MQCSGYSHWRRYLGWSSMREAERWVPIRKKGAVHHLGGERLKSDSRADRSHELCLVYGPHLSCQLPDPVCPAKTSPGIRLSERMKKWFNPPYSIAFSLFSLVCAAYVSGNTSVLLHCRPALLHSVLGIRKKCNLTLLSWSLQ